MSTVSRRTVTVSFDTAIQSAWCNCHHPTIETAGKLWLCVSCGLIHENTESGMTCDMVYGTFPFLRTDSNQDSEPKAGV